jgi:hypothetical protein
MDANRYFRDWFPLWPYYGQHDAIADLAEVWTVRLAAVALMTLALYLIARASDMSLAAPGRRPLVSA